MNISRIEQRVLHALAQGGRIVIARDQAGHVVDAECWTRDGFRLADCTLALFRRLKRRRFVASAASRPYRITRHGLAPVRAQLDNR